MEFANFKRPKKVYETKLNMSTMKLEQIKYETLTVHALGLSRTEIFKKEKGIGTAPTDPGAVRLKWTTSACIAMHPQVIYFSDGSDRGFTSPNHGTNRPPITKEK